MLDQALITEAAKEACALTTTRWRVARARARQALLTCTVGVLERIRWLFRKIRWKETAKILMMILVRAIKKQMIASSMSSGTDRWTHSLRRRSMQSVRVSKSSRKELITTLIKLNQATSFQSLALVQATRTPPRQSMIQARIRT